MVQFQTIWRVFSASFGVVIDLQMKQVHHVIQVAVASLTSKGKFKWDTNPACSLQKHEMKITARPNNFKAEKRRLLKVTSTIWERDCLERKIFFVKVINFFQSL